MSAVEFFSIIKDIALAGAAVTTAYVAYNGLEKWQEELKGKANFEVARELIKCIYNLRDEISYCRSPFVSATEFPEGYRGSLRDCTPEERGQAWAYVYSKRWEPVGDAIKNFDSAVIEAEALWGYTVKEKAKMLRRCARHLQVDIDAYISNEFSDGESFQNSDFAEKIRLTISETKSNDNEFSKKIDAAIEALESVIRPHLARS